MLDKTIYIIGLIIVIILTLQYITYCMCRKNVNREVKKLTHYIIKTKKNNKLDNNMIDNNKIEEQQNNNANKKEKDETIDIDTPQDNDADSYVIALPSSHDGESKEE